MKKLITLTFIAAIATGCAAPKPNPCAKNNSFLSDSSNPCGPEVQINTSYQF